MNLEQKQALFAQPNGKSRIVLANERYRVGDCWAVFMWERNRETGVLLRTNSKQCIWKETLSQQKIRHFNILQSIHFAYDVAIISSYSNRMIYQIEWTNSNVDSNR